MHRSGVVTCVEVAVMDEEGRIVHVDRSRIVSWVRGPGARRRLHAHMRELRVIGIYLHAVVGWVDDCDAFD